MRFLCFLFLVLFAGAVGAFAYFNQQDLTLRFFDWTIDAPVAAVLGITYLLGMLSGWSVLGMVRRSLRAVSDFARERPAVARR
jgi:hypothetical protein